MRLSMPTAGLLALAVIAGCDAPSFSAPTATRPAFDVGNAGGNADAAHACQKGGWQNLQRTDGTRFTNAGDCVSYAAQGGALQSVPTVPLITSIKFDSSGQAGFYFTSVFTGAPTGTLSSNFCGEPLSITVASGVSTPFPNAFDSVTLNVTNAFGTAQQTITFGNSGCA